MKLSVAICTRNRASSLRNTLQSLTYARVSPDLRWEILVVNNNSTDATDLVIDSFADRLPIRRLMARKVGISNARNAAVKAVQGQYILWTDDDVIVSRSWIEEYCWAFERWPNAVLFGGPICPVFEKPVPRWLQKGWHAVPPAFAAVDLGNKPRKFSVRDGKIPYGANFAIRRAEQFENLYNPELGPGTIYYGEETSVIIRMLNAGAEGWWVPAAAVDHMIPQTRMTLEYVWNYYKRSGRSQYYINHHTDLNATAHSERRLLGRPRWLWRRIAEAELKFWLSRIFRSPEHWLTALRIRGEAWGAFEESGRARSFAPADEFSLLD